jgi:transcriptional regulator with XRE-family HTH domain
MVLLRQVLGDTLRAQRLAQHRTLREVSSAAKVSLGYLSEVERGRKEASSELLASICEALGVQLSQVLRDVGDLLAVDEVAPAGVVEALTERSRPDWELVQGGCVHPRPLRRRVSADHLPRPVVAAA